MQLVHATTRTIGREGAIADASDRDILTRLVEASAGLKPGRVVTQGTAARQTRVPVLTGEVSGLVVEGISVYDPGREPGGTNGEYLQNEPVPVIRRGRVWMIAEDAVAEGTAVFVRFTSTGGEEDGRVRSDADSGDAVALPTAIFRGTTTTTDQLVQVELNLP